MYLVYGCHIVVLSCLWVQLCCSVAAPGKKRLYSVPEAPELLDSEAFVGDIVLASEQRNDGLLSHNVEDVQAGEVEEEEEGGIGMAGEREQSSCSVSVAGCDREDPAAIRTPKAEGGSGLMPWLPEEDLAWEGRGKRPRLFGDLGESGSGESGRKKMKMEIGIQTHSESTPSRSSFHHRSASFSTSSPLPPPSPSLLSPRPSPHVSAQSQIHNASGSGSVSADTPSSSGEGEFCNRPPAIDRVTSPPIPTYSGVSGVWRAGPATIHQPSLGQLMSEVGNCTE